MHRGLIRGGLYEGAVYNYLKRATLKAHYILAVGLIKSF